MDEEHLTTAQVRTLPFTHSVTVIMLSFLAVLIKIV